MHFSRILPVALLTYIVVIHAAPPPPRPIPVRPHPEAPEIPPEVPTNNPGPNGDTPPADPHNIPHITPHLGHSDNGFSGGPHDSNGDETGSGLLDLGPDGQTPENEQPHTGSHPGKHPGKGKDDEEGNNGSICSRVPGGLCNGMLVEPTGHDLKVIRQLMKTYKPRDITNDPNHPLRRILYPYVKHMPTRSDSGLGYMGGTNKNAMLRYEAGMEIPVGPWYMDYNKGLFDPQKNPMKSFIEDGSVHQVFQATSEFYMLAQKGNLVVIHDYSANHGLPSYFQPGGNGQLAIYNSVEGYALEKSPEIGAIFVERFEQTDIHNPSTAPALTVITGNPIDPQLPTTRFFIGKGRNFNAERDYHGEPISVAPSKIKDLDSWLPEWQARHNNQGVWVLSSSVDHFYKSDAWRQSDPYPNLYNPSRPYTVQYYKTPYYPGQGSNWYSPGNPRSTPVTFAQ